MPTDDDIRYTVLNYLVQRSHGADFNSCDVAEMWLHKLPFREVCTAETQAYLNFVNIDGILPWSRVPNAMELMREAKVNTYLNPTANGSARRYARMRSAISRRGCREKPRRRHIKTPGFPM